jgi:hypothetical protein
MFSAIERNEEALSLRCRSTHGNFACFKAILPSYETCLLSFRRMFAISKNVLKNAVTLNGLRLMGLVLCSFLFRSVENLHEANQAS